MKALAFLAAFPALIGATVPERSSVLVEVDGLRSAKGLVQACLTADRATFPNCQKDPAALHLSVAAKNGETLVFHDVLPGRYAIALFHDENANGRMDKMMMIPKEGYGFSRDAPVRFGPPSFGAAAFTLGETQLRTAIRVRYLL
ncbi:DUF2141 domain-containing protein [Novosphingobium sp. KCTC 2891]|uniref:DUF2141 domain-containing protein n=1 Tax=Novosphingobium sp. KCTC 2891 TaxID=2989730 RepID=UPI002221A043|nr:DUF2141 domain-containing protein [Novosphingobium sp. KCTC 2891]MCW1382109.1 DUF2141 domain-containing protein [Novosphingobium sp. KCTC 2891]